MVSPGKRPDWECVHPHPPELCSWGWGNPEHPAVVFVHGGPGANSWGFQMSSAKRLARNNYYVLGYDQRGCGRNSAKLKLAVASGRAHKHATTEPDLEKFTLQDAADDLHEVIEHQKLPEPPILVGHSWGGFVSLRYLACHPGKAKGLVLVCTPIDYPRSFHTILTRAHKIYDGIRRLLLMEHFPVMREIEDLKKRMFTDGSRPSLSNEFRDKNHFDFEGDDIKEVFRHAKMLDFASPATLLINSGYRELLDRLSSLESSELLLRVEEKVGPQIFLNDCGEPKQGRPPCMLEMNNNYLLKDLSKAGNDIHAIYGEDDKLFSKGQMEDVRKTLSSFSPSRFSYLYGAGHYPFIEQNRLFIETLCKHLARIRK